MIRVATVLVTTVWMAGCHNPCQRLCVDMAEYATDCGLDVDTTGVDACVEKYASASESALAQCDAWGDEDQLREWWSCEDLADNYHLGGTPDPSTGTTP